jgi:small subunit ribosomal protein S9
MARTAATAAKTSTTKKPKMSETLSKDGRTSAIGGRKEATARVWIARGSGKFIVNGRQVEGYLARPVLRMIVNQPFAATNTAGLYDVWCTVEGSGLSGQAGAIRHGISRALDKLNPDLHPILRQGGFLTRDSRAVERKKYGHKKARKRFQFSKR